MKMEEEKLEAQMEYAKYEHETEMLRERKWKAGRRRRRDERRGSGGGTPTNRVVCVQSCGSASWTASARSATGS